MANIERKIGKGVVFQFFSFGVAGLVQILFIPFIINALGKSQYGIYEIAFSLSLFNALLEVGVGSTITNYIKKSFEKNHEEYRSFFWSFFWFKFTISLLVCLICILIAFNLSFFYHNVDSQTLPILKQSIIWFAFGAILTNLVSFFDNVQTGFVRYDLNSITNISSKLFFVFAFFTWFFTWAEINIAQFCFITFVLVPLFRLLHQLIIIINKQPEILVKPKRFEFNQISSKLHFLGGFSLITFIAQFYNYGIAFLLGLVAMPSVVGEFGIIKRVVDLVNGISDMLVRPIMPAASDLLKKYKQENIIYNMTNIHAVVVISLTTALIINSSTLSKYFLNDKYNHFNFHLIIMALPRLLPSVIVMLMLYYAAGKTQLSVIKQSLKLVFALFLGYIGFNLFDFGGLLVGLSLGIMISLFINLNQFFSYYKGIKVTEFLQIYFPKWIAAFFCIICQIIIQYLIGVNLVSIILWNLMGLIIFVAFLQKDVSNFIKRYQSIT